MSYQRDKRFEERDRKARESCEACKEIGAPGGDGISYQDHTCPEGRAPKGSSSRESTRLARILSKGL